MENTMYKILFICIALIMFLILLPTFILPTFNFAFEYNAQSIKSNSESNLNSVDGTTTDLAYGDLVSNSETFIYKNIFGYYWYNYYQQNTSLSVSDSQTDSAIFLGKYLVNANVSTITVNITDIVIADKVEFDIEIEESPTNDNILVNLTVCKTAVMIANATCSGDETQLVYSYNISKYWVGSGHRTIPFNANFTFSSGFWRFNFTGNITGTTGRYRLRSGGAFTFGNCKVSPKNIGNVWHSYCAVGDNEMDRLWMNLTNYNTSLITNSTIMNLTKNTNYTINYGSQSQVAQVSWVDTGSVTLVNGTYNYNYIDTSNWISNLLMTVFLIILIVIVLYFVPRRK